jgi:hypothetical protein
MVVQHLVGEVCGENRANFCVRSPLLNEEKHGNTRQQDDDNRRGCRF